MIAAPSSSFFSFFPSRCSTHTHHMSHHLHVFLLTMAVMSSQEATTRRPAPQGTRTAPLIKLHHPYHDKETPSPCHFTSSCGYGQRDRLATKPKN
uniref:Uncharacterized protein n=1 Tax=Lotus japonicus TaxID=34305 RepID=I3T7V5_LOTJA|nr:unknown [Lotus japonicus]